MKNPGDIVTIDDRVILVLSSEPSMAHSGSNHVCLDSVLLRTMVEDDYGKFTNGILGASVTWELLKAKVRQTPLKWTSYTMTVCKSDI